MLRPGVESLQELHLTTRPVNLLYIYVTDVHTIAIEVLATVRPTGHNGSAAARPTRVMDEGSDRRLDEVHVVPGSSAERVVWRL